MDCVFKLAQRRETVREFENEEISLEDVIYAIKTAREAPSGANKQPWRFLIITDGETKKKIREKCEEAEKIYHGIAPEWKKKWMKERGITWQKPHLTEAPVLLLVFADITAPMAVQSVWLAVGYLLLALEEKGLKTVTYTPSKISWANEMFGIPNKFKLQTILPIGKKKKTSTYKKQKRLPLNNILFIEQFGIPCKE